jgi:AcrR family transcriptional regulator
MTARRPRHDDTARIAKRAQRRNELLDAASAAIRRDGAGVSMEALAAEAGVTKPILYKHFGDRDGLVAALAERFGGALIAELETNLGRDLPPEQLLRSTVDAYLAFIERDPNVYRFLVPRLSVHLGNGVDQLGIVSHLGRRIALVVGEQLRALGLDSGMAEPWAFGIIGMVHLSGEWWVDRQTLPRARLVEYLSDLLWHGMGGVSAKALQALAALEDGQ